MTDPTQWLDQLVAATNAHDIDSLVACFADDYLNETPVHPERGFRGPDQVRRNWTAIFGGVPDISARILSSAVDGDRIWTEWEMSGTRRDGAPHEMRGVVIFEVRQAQAHSARFYLEPVDQSGGTVDDAVHRSTGAGPA